jgi:hypothetical protein
MSNVIIQQGNRITTAHTDSIKIREQLPAQNYTVGFNRDTGQFFLEPTAPFSMPAKLYDNSPARAARVLTTFQSRPRTTGVLLNGVKGAGKTLLAKQISIQAAALGMPTVLINKPWCGDEFNQFIQSFEQEMVLIFDEFEKVYDYKEQRQLLTLLDGVFPTKKLFVMTTNDTTNVSSLLTNRPGRMFYNFTYDYLSPELIAAFCEDNLNDKSQIPAICSYARIYRFFNFDIITSIVEEMNRYNESFDDVLANGINVSPDENDGDAFKISVSWLGETIVISNDWEGYTPNHWNYSLEQYELGVGISSSAQARGSRFSVSKEPDKLAMLLEDTKAMFGDDSCIQFTPDDIVKYDNVLQSFVYRKTINGTVIEITAAKVLAAKTWDWRTAAF